MSIFDQQQLLASIHPFDLLESRVIAQLSTHMDIAYYPKETVLIGPRLPAEHLYIIIKGNVSEFIGDELHNVYTARDSFDANALIYGDTQSRFVVQEDLICYLLPKEVFLNLIQDYEPFRSYFMKDFIAKHQSLKERQQQNDLTPFMMAKVADIFLHEVCLVPDETSVHSALVKMNERKATTILVDGTVSKGIITDTDLRDKVLIAETPLNAPVKDSDLPVDHHRHKRLPFQRTAALYQTWHQTTCRNEGGKHRRCPGTVGPFKPFCQPFAPYRRADKQGRNGRGAQPYAERPALSCAVAALQGGEGTLHLQTGQRDQQEAL